MDFKQYVAELDNEIDLVDIADAIRMQLLDEFAKAALIGLLSAGTGEKATAPPLAVGAYQMARAMLEERERQK